MPAYRAAWRLVFAFGQKALKIASKSLNAMVLFFSISRSGFNLSMVAVVPVPFMRDAALSVSTR